MRILYVAKHDSGGNDDEGAISHALEELGHIVWKVQEHRADQDVHKYTKADFCLFHKWDGWDELRYLNGRMPRVFWYFDLVDFPDVSLTRRNENRKTWMSNALPNVEMGFCTDGDWVRRVNSDGKDKLRWLPQGTDSRVAGRNDWKTPQHGILFTGIGKGGGTDRESFVKNMKTMYPRNFLHIQSGCYRWDLARRIAQSQIVLAPASPVTNCYWSNRVYMALGFGAFMIHPLCDRLMDHYTADQEIVYYNHRTDGKQLDLHHKIKWALEHPEDREEIARAGLKRTLAEHTYRHRVESMFATLKEKHII